MSRRLVMIGNGMAGARCIEEILRRDRDRYEITMIGDEPYPNYNRIMLSPVLQGKTTFEEITINDWDWYQSNNIHLLSQERAVEINRASKEVRTGRGTVVPYT